MVDFLSLEQKWHDRWNHGHIQYSAPKHPKSKKYILIEFPFPSGSGLHVGHVKSYVALDIRARKYRMQGYDVLYPIGWDAFGLPTELYALKHKIHPEIATRENISRFKEQIQSLAISFDWGREINTSDPSYYRWTQWIFLQMFRHNLAYQDSTLVWWCPELKTVLANEEVIDGKSERGGYPCERRPLTQWMLAITKYAARLHEDLDEVDYLPVIKTQQRNWIGKSEGTRVTFQIKNSDQILEVFSTRVETIYGVSYLVLAPEHPALAHMTSAKHIQAIEEYQSQTRTKSELDRKQSKAKTGVFTGAYAVHPLTGIEIPIWISDYVLMGYGTGAVMGVPAHDERDREFAEQYKLPIQPVIIEVQTGGQVLVNSGQFDGLSPEEARQAMTELLIHKRQGIFETQYKLRDWVFSRQRYWGEPFPIVWISEDAYSQLGDAVNQLVPEKPVTRIKHNQVQYAAPLSTSELPLTLPRVRDLEPQGLGEGPLSKAMDWVEVWYDLETGKTLPRSQAKPEGSWVEGTRETDTMPNWAGSSWYFLRYIDPTNDTTLADLNLLKEWMPVDVYNGGMEHVTLHLLYSRFWHKFLYDIGVVPTKEPYQKRIFHGMVLASGGVKMSKSKGNTIDPLEMSQAFGADSLRCYILFMGPYDEAIAWDTNGLIGCNRFLTKMYHWVESIVHSPQDLKPTDNTGEFERDLHGLIKKVTLQIEDQKFNTCISAMMEVVNTWGKSQVSQDALRDFILILAPFAPFLSEELWEMLGGKGSVHAASWPQWDEEMLVTENVEYQVHINGKMRAMITINKNWSLEQIKQASLDTTEVTSWIQGEIITHKIISNKNIIIVVTK